LLCDKGHAAAFVLIAALVASYGASFVKKLYRIHLAHKLLSQTD